MQVKYRREKDCCYHYLGKKKSDDRSMFYIRSCGIKSKKVFARFRHKTLNNSDKGHISSNCED